MSWLGHELCFLSYFFFFSFYRWHDSEEYHHHTFSFYSLLFDNFVLCLKDVIIFIFMKFLFSALMILFIFIFHVTSRLLTACLIYELFTSFTKPLNVFLKLYFHKKSCFSFLKYINIFNFVCFSYYYIFGTIAY